MDPYKRQITELALAHTFVKNLLDVQRLRGMFKVFVHLYFDKPTWKVFDAVVCWGSLSCMIAQMIIALLLLFFIMMHTLRMEEKYQWCKWLKWVVIVITLFLAVTSNAVFILVTVWDARGYNSTLPNSSPSLGTGIN